MSLRLLVTVTLLTGCNFSPLMNRIEVGEDPFVVVTGEGKDGRTDLFAVNAGGGTLSQLTFTNQVEQGPVLTVGGAMLAYLRMRDTLPETAREIVVMNVISGSERVLPLPAAAGQPHQLGWSDDEATLYVRTALGIWALATPPAESNASIVAPDDAHADTALTLWLGRPRFAKAITCAEAVCAITAHGDTMTLTPRGTSPFRWGTDSVAWFEGEHLTVRSLGPGPSRRVAWSRAPANARGGAYAAATAAKAP